VGGDNGIVNGNGSGIRHAVYDISFNAANSSVYSGLVFSAPDMFGLVVYPVGLILGQSAPLCGGS
jgi:hypothetical protein